MATDPRATWVEQYPRAYPGHNPEAQARSTVGKAGREARRRARSSRLRRWAIKTCARTSVKFRRRFHYDSHPRQRALCPQTLTCWPLLQM